jgi:DNA-binding transcriptional regulator LsrR (DeoR family)
MKPILIIRVPKDAVEHIPVLQQKLARKFKLYKVTVVFDDEKQKGLKFSVVNTLVSQDEIIEKDVLHISKSTSVVILVLMVMFAKIKSFFKLKKS